MNKEHPEDNAQGRFAARVMIVIALLVFIAAVSFVLWFSNSGIDRAENMVEDDRANGTKEAKGRIEKLAVVNEAQQVLVTQAAVVDQAKNLVRIPVKEGMKLVLPILKSKKEGPTKVLVPGSPTQLKQSQAAPAKDKDGAKDDKASEKKEGAEPKAKAPEKK